MYRLTCWILTPGMRLSTRKSNVEILELKWMQVLLHAVLPTVSGEGPPLGSAPSLPSPRSMDTDPVYTEAVTVSGSRKVTQQPAIEG